MNESPLTRITAAAGWIGLVLFVGWREYFLEADRRLPIAWWFRIPATAMIGLALLVFALECLQQDMTVRRWATSLVVFAAFGILFLAVGIFDPETLQLSRGLLIPAGVFYLGAAVAAGAGTKDSM